MCCPASEGQAGVLREGAKTSLLPRAHVTQSESSNPPAFLFPVVFVLGFSSNAAQPLNWRVPHPSRFVRRVGSYDRAPQFLFSLVFRSGSSLGGRTFRSDIRILAHGASAPEEAPGLLQFCCSLCAELFLTVPKSVRRSTFRNPLALDLPPALARAPPSSRSVRNSARSSQSAS